MSATLASMNDLATHLRTELDEKKFVLLYAYNGTGKTRLSMAFKDIGKQGEGEDAMRDTLYFNAFTEDLFTWDNDLEGDSARALKMNATSVSLRGWMPWRWKTAFAPSSIGMPILISPSTTAIGRSTSRAIFKWVRPRGPLTISRCRAARRACLSGASFWPSFNLQWMVRKPISGSSISTSMIQLPRWMSIMQLQWGITWLSS